LYGAEQTDVCFDVILPPHVTIACRSLRTVVSNIKHSPPLFQSSPPSSRFFSDLLCDFALTLAMFPFKNEKDLPPVASLELL
jgi:hypothetical protein